MCGCVLEVRFYVLPPPIFPVNLSRFALPRLAHLLIFCLFLAGVAHADLPAAPQTPLFVGVTSQSVQVQIATVPQDAYQVVLQYKASGGSWINAGTYDSYASYYGSQYPAEINGLTPETIYLVRWVADGYDGSTAGSANAVTTSPAPPDAPDVPAVGQITSTSAHVVLPALPTGASSLRLEKATGDGYYGYYGEGPVFETVASDLAGGASVNLSDLSPQAYYSVRVVAVGDGGETAGYSASFSTLPPAPDAPAAPTFEEVSASSLQVPLPAFPTYANQLKLQRRLAGAGTWSDVGQFDNWYGSGGERAYVYDLLPETAYDFHWLAVGEGGQTAGATATVTTTPAPPETPEAPTFSSITATSARVILPALPQGATTLRLEKRTNDDPYNPTYVTIAEALGGGDSVTVSSLTPDSYIAFRAVALGVGGETAGAEGTCNTPSLPPGVPPAPQFSNVGATQLNVTVPTAPSNTNSLRLQVKLAAAGNETYSDVTQVNVGEGYAPPSVTASNLQPATAYAFRWIAIGNGGDTAGASSEVTTLPAGDGGEPSATPTPVVQPTPTPTVAPTPTPVPLPRPVDVTLRAGDENAADNFTGEDIYSNDGDNQKINQSAVPDSTTTYTVQVQNQTSMPASFTVTAPGDELGWSVRYYAIAEAPSDPEAEPTPPEDVTDGVTGEGWATPVLEPQARCTLRVTVEATTLLNDGATKNVPLQASPMDGTPDDVDVVQVITVLDIIDAPLNLTAAAGEEQVLLNWNAVTAASGYNLYRSTTNSGPYDQIATNLTVTNYTDTQVTGGTRYFYVVRSFNGTYESANSNQVSALPTFPPPPLPPVDLWVAGESEDLHAMPEFIGNDAYNLDGAGQSHSDYTIGITTHTSFVRVQNDSSLTASFAVQGDGDSAGWSVKYFYLSSSLGINPEFDALIDPEVNAQDITEDITGEGWTTPELASNATCVLRVEVTPTTSAIDGNFKSVLVRAAPASDSSLADVVKLDTTYREYIAGLQYSFDQTQTWHDIDANGNNAATGLPLEVEAGVNFSLRAIKKHPQLAWPFKPLLAVINPEWDRAGVPLCGESISVSFEEASATPYVVTAECGNTASVKVKVNTGPRGE